MPNIRDVATAAGVSAATVSRTFTTPSLVHDSTHRRVMEVARRLGYRSRPEKYEANNGIHPIPPTNTNNIIGFQFIGNDPGDTLLGNDFYGPILHGAEKEAATLGLHILVNTANRFTSRVEIPRMLREQVVCGLLLVGSPSQETIRRMARHTPNIILVDSIDDTHTYESVVADSFGGGYSATQYLLRLGHRERIAFLMPRRNVRTFQERLRGFICALFENGLTIDQQRIIVPSEDEEDSTVLKQRVASLLLSKQRPTALFCANDYHAHMVVQVCWDIGLKVPEDISVVGFDDVEFSRHASPPLTTVQVDKEFMGRVAVRRLFHRLNDPPELLASQMPQTRLREPQVIPVTLAVRGSCRMLEKQTIDNQAVA